jgi:hypothetical protein
MTMPRIRKRKGWLVTRDGRVAPARIRWGNLTGFRRLRDQFGGYTDVSVWLLAVAGAWVALSCVIGVAADLRERWWLVVAALAVALSLVAVIALLAIRGLGKTKHHPVFALVANRDVADGAADLAVVADAGFADHGRNRRYRIVLANLNSLASAPDPDPLALRLFRSDAADLRRRWAGPADLGDFDSLPPDEDPATDPVPDVVDLTQELLGKSGWVDEAESGSSGGDGWLRHHLKG